MATKENIKQLYTEDGKTKIYPVVISDSLTTDDGNTTGADAIGKWLAGAHIYAKNLTVSADPLVMNSTDRLALYNFVETQGNASGQTMTINMPLTIGVNAESGGNKNGNIIVNNDTTSINSYSGVSFRGNKTEMTLGDVNDSWGNDTFKRNSGLIINSKKLNNTTSIVIGNRDIFTIGISGKVGSFGSDWFGASSENIPIGGALCLQNKGGDVKIGGSLLVSGNERINGKVRIYGSGTYLDIFEFTETVDGLFDTTSTTQYKMGVNAKDSSVVEIWNDAQLGTFLTVKSNFSASIGDSGIWVNKFASYAKIGYINLGGTSNSKINDPSNWVNKYSEVPDIFPKMKAASITRPGGSIPGGEIPQMSSYTLKPNKNYAFSTAGKAWDSSGIVSSENHIVAIDKNKEITPLYLNYPTNDVHGGVSVYDLSVKNAFYLGDEDVKLYKNGTNLNINTYNSTNMTFNVISSDSYDADNSAFMVKCRLASVQDNNDALKLRIGTTYASFRDSVCAKVNDMHDVYLGVPVGTVVSWYDASMPEHWDRWNDKRIYYVGERRPSESPGYRCIKYTGDISVTVDGKPMWRRTYASPSGNDFDKVTYRIEDKGYNAEKTTEWCFYVYPEINNTYKFWDTFHNICQQYVNIYIKKLHTVNRMCYDNTDMNDHKYEVMDNDDILIKYDLRDIYPIKIIKVE